MSTDTEVAEAGQSSEHGDDHHDAEEHGLSFIGAIKVAIFLAVVTGIEVLTYFIDFGVVANPLLIILMIVKFAVVVAYFMHLRYDNLLYTALFVIGIVLALAVYLATLTSMEWFA